MEEPVSPVYFDLLGKTQFELNRRHNLALDVFAATDEFDEGETDVLVVDHRSRYAWLILTSAWSADLYSQTVLSVGRLERRRHQLDFISGPPLELDDQRWLDSLTFKMDWGSALSGNHDLQWGFDLRRLDASYDYTSTFLVSFPFLAAIFGDFTNAVTVRRDVDLEVSGERHAAYVSDTVRLNPRLTLGIGLRWDDQSYTADGQQWSPRLNLGYRLGESSVLRVGWGHFYQSQGIHELQVGDGLDEFHPAQLSEHRVVGFEHRFSGPARRAWWSPLVRGLELRVEGYQKRISNVRPRFESLFDPNEFVSEAQADRVHLAPDQARAEGVEILLKQASPRRFNWWLSYALASVEDHIDGEWVPRGWDQRHTLRSSLNMKLRDWNFNLAGNYHSGWPTTELFLTLEAKEGGGFRIRPIVGPRNSERLPDTLSLDLRVSRRLELKKHGTLTFFLEVVNLLDRKNVCCFNDPVDLRTMDGITFEVVLDEGWLPRLPSFGISWEI